MSIQRKEELYARKKVNEKADIEDYLTEDPIITNQQYFVLSYLLPKEHNEIISPVFKVRGSYKTQEECEKRINKLKELDSYFNMYICEVGKFGTLLTEEEIRKDDEIDFQYRETMLNDMVKSYKENKDLADMTYKRRKEEMTKKIKEETSKEGQELLSNSKESPLSVKTRIETTRKHIRDLQDDIKKCEEMCSKDQYLYDTLYTKEEIEEAERLYREQYPEKFKVDDFKSLSTIEEE